MSPLYRTFTATAFSIYVLIKIKSCSGSAPTASSIQTLTMDLTSTILGKYQGGAGQAPMAMLTYKGFVVCIIGMPYNFIAFLIYPSLSFTVLWFLLCLIYSSLMICPAYQAARTTPVCKYLSSPFPRSSLMSFRISISFCYFWLLSFGYCGWVTLCWVYCSVAFFCVSTHL